MQFNEEQFKAELETILYKHSHGNGLTGEGMKAFTYEVEQYTQGLFGNQSIAICPLCQRPEYIWKIIIYVSPTNDSFSFQYDYHYDVPALGFE